LAAFFLAGAFFLVAFFIDGFSLTSDFATLKSAVVNIYKALRAASQVKNEGTSCDQCRYSNI
jgi:hypothetical protein